MKKVLILSLVVILLIIGAVFAADSSPGELTQSRADQADHFNQVSDIADYGAIVQSAQIAALERVVAERHLWSDDTCTSAGPAEHVDTYDSRIGILTRHDTRKTGDGARSTKAGKTTAATQRTRAVQLRDI